MLQPFDDEQLLENIRLKLGPDVVAPRPQRPAPDTRSWTLPGFGGKARVATSFGNLPIEALRLRDPVRTQSGKYLKVQWIDKIQLDAKFLSLHPKTNPIVIPRASLDRQLPISDVLVSPVQTLKLPRHTSGTSTAYAESLVGRGYIARKPQNGFTYYLFHCGEPACVNIEGLWFDVSPE